MERAPTVQEESELKPTLSEAKIILWDELYGAHKDIARGQKEVSASKQLETLETFVPAEQ